MIEGVYMQPVSRTLAELKDTGIDMTKVMKGEWQDRPVWIVGAASPSDTTSPQFWIDIERNVVVRMMIIPAPNAGPMDIHLDGYVPLEQGLARDEGRDERERKADSDRGILGVESERRFAEIAVRSCDVDDFAALGQGAPNSKTIRVFSNCEPNGEPNERT